MRIIIAASIGAGLVATSATAQQYNPHTETVRVKSADSRQRRGETPAVTKGRNTRCKIVVQKGQDKRVCGVPTNMSPGDGRKQ
jgi:hypothetical protein